MDRLDTAERGAGQRRRDRSRRNRLGKSRTVALLTLAATALLTACAATTTSRAPMGFERGVAAAGTSRLLVVDFGAPWCGPCKQMEATTWASPVVRDWIFSHAVRVHVDIEQRPELASRYDIAGVPTTIAFRNGREVGREVGYRGPDRMLNWLRGI